AVMLLADGWIKRLTGRPGDYAVTYHPDQHEEQLVSFWSEYLGVAPTAIRCHRKSNSGRLSRRVWRCQHGVMAIASHDTYFRSRMGAWVDLIKAEWAGPPE